MRLSHRAVTFFVAAAMSLSAGSAAAAPWDGQAKLLLHVRSVIQQNACGFHGALDDCGDAVTSGSLTVPQQGPYWFVYLLGARATGMAGISEIVCGIDYQGGATGAMGDHVGIDVLAWRLCATLDTPSIGAPEWPRPGGGITILWDLPESCQENEVAVSGYFYIAAYSPDILQLTAEPVSGEAMLENCQSVEFDLTPSEDLGSARFSAVGDQGCNPCDVACDEMPVRPATWAAIKAQFD